MTAVGGGNFSSPVTVYLEEPSEDSGPVVVIATVTVNLVVLTATFSLLVASVLGYKYWLVYGKFCYVAKHTLSMYASCY